MSPGHNPLAVVGVSQKELRVAVLAVCEGLQEP